MPDETQKPENGNAKRNWKNYVSTVATLAALVAAGAAIYSLSQSERLNLETAFLQHTQHRVSSCIAISQHHYAMWERDEAIGWNEETRLIIDGNESDDDGQPILMTRNYERANKAIGLARQLALCTSSDPEKTRTCINSNVDQNPKWLVNDDNVGQGHQPQQGSRNPVC